MKRGDLGIGGPWRHTRNTIDWKFEWGEGVSTMRGQADKRGGGIILIKGKMSLKGKKIKCKN